MDTRGKLSLVIGLFGRYELLIKQFNKMIEEVKELNEVELIVVADGENWTSIPLYQMLPIIYKDAKFLVNEGTCDLPSKLYNMGIEVASNEYVTFIYPGCEGIHEVVKAFFEQDEHIENVYASQVSLIPGIDITNQNRYGFLQVVNSYSPMDLFIKTDVIKKHGGFNPSKLLQTHFVQELALRLSRDYPFGTLGIINHKAPPLDFFPFHSKFRISKDLIARYIIRNSRLAFPNEKREKIEDEFLQDLNREDAQKVIKLMGKNDVKKNQRYNHKYRITVIGGYWEYHHNQICFFNYFENLYGQGFSSYKSCLEELTTGTDLETSDLVIFSRCRSSNALELIEFCNSKGIPTIYMIDDNWISIAKDHPEYGGIFIKGNPNYDNFIEAISKCDTTWVFNDKLIEDIKPFAKSITKFSISVEPRLFETSNKQLEENNKLKIGFSGSLRYDDTAFQALAQVVRKHKKNITIILSGIVSEQQRELFNELDVIEVPFLNYPTYARNISKLNIDLLIAPLTDTRTAKSKCYNKYVESSIIKAACIYSKTEPYTLVVREGYNGFFVEDESIEGWKDKIEELITHPKLLKQVQENAYQDVIKNHIVEVLLDEFVSNINRIVKAGELEKC